VKLLPVSARAAALGVALLLAAPACSSRDARLDAANALRHKGDPKAALDGYKALLADLGEGPLGGGDAAVRWKALRYAGDLSYLELGDYTSAVAYYRRIVSLVPGSKEAHEARVLIGEILRDRFNDPLGAITQWSDVAGSQAPEAPKYQLEIARAYLELKRYDQARAEARRLQERWPAHALADEAQLLVGQAWSLEKRDDEALGALGALLERRPPPEVAARALEAEAHLYAQQGKLDRALELYALALPTHPNPDSVRTAIDAVRDRRERAKIARPGRAEAFK
jgi:tetratricopeptide (TPR) repeat protein